MIPDKSLAVYKNRPALVKGKEGDKIIISVYESGKSLQEFKVREKDIEMIHPGPVTGLDGIESETADAAAREAWELLLGEGGGPVSVKELAELASGEYSPGAAWAAFRLLLDGLYFTGTAAALSPRPREAVEAEEKKRQEKERESEERERFLGRLKNRCLDLAGDGRFMQDVEALAYGKSAKSRTLKELGLPETPEDAHALLLDTGFWTAMVNPYPGRFGLSVVSSKIIPDPPPEEERRDLTHLPAFAIDSPWSDDPDDAVSIEKAGEKWILYVHVADPAAALAPDSPLEREARDRGATLYLPEGISRMLAEEALPLFALGLAEQSPALTFKITIEETGEITDVDIFPSVVKARRLTYEEADKLMDGGAGTGTDSSALQELAALAEGNLRRRSAAGAVNIDLPETHITVSNGQVRIEPIIPYRSGDLVRECMLLAGEGAALWAAGIRGKKPGGAAALPFPYISQEEGELPNEVPPGMAGSYRLRRCMRPRTLSTKPGRHWGLGLAAYTQVTSPLRRYSDLLAHMQIRSLLSNTPLLSTDEIALRLGAGEAAAAAAVQAERASRQHWTMVYLADKKDSVWDAAALEKKGNRWAVMIPALAMETQVPLRQEPAPNEHIELILKSVNIPKNEAVFIVQKA